MSQRKQGGGAADQMRATPQVPPDKSVARISHCRLVSQRRGLVGLIRAFLACCLAVLIARQPAAAQQRAAAPAKPPIQVAQFAVTRTAPKQEIVNVFLPAPRELKLLLSQARRDLGDKRYNDAVASLGTLLERLGTDPANVDDYAGDYFVGTPGQEGTFVSLRAEALRLIGSMPPNGLEWYQLQYGAQANLLLEQALDSADIAKLEEVSRRFFHTQAGYQATMLLGWYHLDRGRPLAAALCMKRVACTVAAARRFDPELSVLLAVCWMSSNDHKRARETLKSLSSRLPRMKLRIGGKATELFATGASPDEWLRDHIDLPQQSLAGNAEQWVMFRGDAQRNAQVSGSAPLTNFRWFVRLALAQSDQEEVRQVQRQYIEQHLPALPAMHPLVVNDTVLMRTPWHLFAVDFKTGKRVWHYPWDPDLDEQFQNRQASSAAGPMGPRMQYVQQRIWSDAPYGELTSDGRHIFLIDRLGFATSALGPHIRVGFGGQRTTNPGQPRAYNRLCALNLEQEGKLSWIVGDETGEEEPRLNQAFFLGPPLVLQRQLYVMVERKGEIQLVALDADTGRLSWSQQLAHVDTATIDRAPARRLAGATPSYADGVLVCPTSAGAIVAVDISTRSLLWGYQYQQTRGNVPAMVLPSRFSSVPNQPGSRWDDATATIADGRVLVTPVESGELHCLDLLTGKVEWKIPRGDALYVGCVHEGVVLLVGKDRLHGIQLSDGNPAWEAQVIPSGGMPAGRGFFSKHQYFLPTTAEELIRLDVPSGQLTKPMKTRGVLGNLVCHRDVVISQGVNLLTSFHQLDPLRVEVAERLKTAPDDIWALCRQSELLLYDGKQKEALEILRKAHRMQSGDDTRSLLIETLLSVLREDFASNRELAAEAEQLISRPDQQEEYLRLVAEGLRQMGDRMQAFEAYLRIAGFERGAEPGVVPGESDSMQQVSDHLSVRRDRWVQTRLASLIGAAADDERKTMQTAIERQFDDAAGSDSLITVRRFIRHFDGHPLADKARVELAAQLIEKDRLLQAEMLLARAQQSSDRSLAGAATAGRARLLARAEHFQEAAAFYRQLAEQWPDVECVDGMTGKELLAAIPSDGPVGRALAARRQWPGGEVTASLTDDVTAEFSRNSRLYRLNVLSADALPLPGMRAALDPARARIVVRDGTGREIIQIPLTRRSGTSFYSSNFGLTRARFYGHLLVLSMGFEIMALDTLQVSPNADKREIWRHDMSQTVPGNSRTRTYVRPVAVNNPWCGPTYVPRDQLGNPVGMLGPLTDRGLTFMRGRMLVCVDPISGEEIWQRSDCVSGSSLFGDKETIVVIAPNSNQAQLYRASDGAKIRTVGVPPGDRLWRTHGRRLLTWDDLPGKMVLRLFDPLTDTDAWAFDFVVGSKGWVVEGNEVAVLEPDGQFVIIDMLSGSKTIDTRIAKEESLTGVYVLADSKRYVVVTNTPPTQAEPNVHISAAPSGYYSPLINGRAYAFDRKTGESLWPQAVRVKQFGLPLQQASELPVLSFLRQVRKTESGRATGDVTSIMCVDKRTGEVLFQDDKIPTQTRAFEMVGNLDDAVVSLLIPGKTINLQFKEEGADPSPSEGVVEESSDGPQPDAEPPSDDSAAPPTDQTEDAESDPSADGRSDSEDPPEGQESP